MVRQTESAGAGALWVRSDLKLAPIILGGGQEGGVRSGTENLPAIAGMGVAADLWRSERAAETTRLTGLRDRLLAGLLERVPETRITGARGAARLPHHASVVIRGVKADGVLMELDLRGVAASSGSACNLSTGEPSHVLRAIGCSREEYEGSLCFTLGRWTTAAEIDTVLEDVAGNSLVDSVSTCSVSTPSTGTAQSRASSSTNRCRLARCGSPRGRWSEYRPRTLRST